jgi:hypothetical protein
MAPRSYTNIYRRTTRTIALEPQHGALTPCSVGLHVARTGFMSWSAKNGLTAAQKPNFLPFSARERLRNGSETARGTAKKRLSARLAILLDVINDRGKFHTHRARHRGEWAERVWWCPQGRDPRRNSKMSGPACTHPKTYLGANVGFEY